MAASTKQKVRSTMANGRGSQDCLRRQVGQLTIIIHTCETHEQHSSSLRRGWLDALSPLPKKHNDTNIHVCMYTSHQLVDRGLLVMSIMHASYLLLLQFFCSVYFLQLQVSFEIMSSTSHYLYYITIYIAVETIPRLRGCYALPCCFGGLIGQSIIFTQ